MNISEYIIKSLNLSIFLSLYGQGKTILPIDKKYLSKQSCWWFELLSLWNYSQHKFNANAKKKKQPNIILLQLHWQPCGVLSHLCPPTRLRAKLTFAAGATEVLFRF